MIEINRFQILNADILKRGSTCTRKIHAQSDLQKHSYYLKEKKNILLEMTVLRLTQGRKHSFDNAFISTGHL